MATVIVKILCALSTFNYGDPTRGHGYEYANIVPALRRLGHDVFVFDTRCRSRYRDFGELNRDFLMTVDRERPDLVFAVLVYYELWVDTWEILRESGIGATLNWSTDDSWRYSQFSRLVAPSFVAFTTTYRDRVPRYERDGIGHVCATQWAANSEYLKPPKPARECSYAVTFVGTAHGRRKAWVRDMKCRGVNVQCYGHGWPGGAIPAERIPIIIRDSTISLNFANSTWSREGMLPRQRNQVKARTFEVPGAGGFLLTERADGLEDWYRCGEEVATFRSVEDLARKIAYYLGHPTERDRIAKAGFARTRRDHIYENRLASVLEFAMEAREKYWSRRTEQPAHSIDWNRFKIAVRSHRNTTALNALRRGLLLLCNAAWGASRGPRAARRIVYELSWRLAGRRTYSAAGLPGRLFYDAS